MERIKKELPLSQYLDDWQKSVEENANGILVEEYLFGDAELFTGLDDEHVKTAAIEAAPMLALDALLNGINNLISVGIPFWSEAWEFVYSFAVQLYLRGLVIGLSTNGREELIANTGKVKKALEAQKEYFDEMGMTITLLMPEGYDPELQGEEEDNPFQEGKADNGNQ